MNTPNMPEQLMSGHSPPTDLVAPEAMQEAALAHARLGFRIFPVSPRDKRPLVKGWGSEASAEETQVSAWWSRWPHAMIGLPTGAANGLWVLDLDVDAEKGLDGNTSFMELEVAHGAIDIDVCATTPRGGTHLFFRWDAAHPVHNSVGGHGGVAPGIDVRGEGGFVVIAPSVRDDARAYAWVNAPLGEADLTDAPDWLYALMEKPVLSKSPPSAGEAKSISSCPAPTDDPLIGRKRAYAMAALEREAEAVASSAEGGRNHRLNVAANAIGNFVGEEILAEAQVREALTAAALQAGLSVGEIGRTLTSGLKAGRTKPARWPPEWAEELADIERGRALSARLLAGTANSVPAIGPTWDNPDRSPLGEGRRLAPRFKVEWLGPQLAQWAEGQARATCAPVDYVCAAMLALIGGLLGNRRRPLAGAGWEEPPTLFVAMVGDPSSGKSPASSAVMSLVNAEEASLDADYRNRMRDYETEKVAADAVMAAHKTALREALRGDPELAKALPPALPDGFAEPVKPYLKRIVVRDSTVERLATLSAENPTGLLLHRDELAGLFASFGRYSGGGGSDRQFFLECYGGRAFTVDRVKSGDPVRVDHLSIGIVGALQPDKAADLLKGADDGFVSRFLWCWPDPVPGFRIARDLLDRSAAERVVNRICFLNMRSNPVPLGDTPVLVPLEEGALVVLERFARGMKEREARAAPLMKSALGKARGHALRLSCILSYMWWASSPNASPFEEPQEIAADAMVAAVEMMASYFLPMAERVFGDAGVPVTETNAAILARHLRQEGRSTFNARTVRRAIGGALRTADAMEAAIEDLVEACLVRPVSQPLRSKKAKDFEVNPALLSPGEGGVT